MGNNQVWEYEEALSCRKLLFIEVFFSFEQHQLKMMFVLEQRTSFISIQSSNILGTNNNIAYKSSPKHYAICILLLSMMYWLIFLKENQISQESITFIQCSCMSSVKTILYWGIISNYYFGQLWSFSLGYWLTNWISVYLLSSLKLILIIKIFFLRLHL